MGRGKKWTRSAGARPCLLVCRHRHRHRRRLEFIVRTPSRLKNRLPPPDLRLARPDAARASAGASSHPRDASKDAHPNQFAAINLLRVDLSLGSRSAPACCSAPLCARLKSFIIVVGRRVLGAFRPPPARSPTSEPTQDSADFARPSVALKLAPPQMHFAAHFHAQHVAEGGSGAGVSLAPLRSDL